MNLAPTQAPRAAKLHLVALAGACAALAFKPISYASLWVLVAIGVVAWLGSAAIENTARPARVWTQLGVGALGLAAFLVARMTQQGFGIRLTALGVAGILLAGVAEEAFFRGYMHSWLRRNGLGVVATAAVTTILFALIHVPTYGAWVLPIDLAAGAIFAWQRQVSGTWVVPAVTHALANLMQLG